MPAKYEEIEYAYQSANDGDIGEFLTAYVSRKDGRIYIHDESEPSLNQPPEDFEEPERYIEIPDKRDLNLGKYLVFDFVDEEIPEARQAIRGIFSHRGAYSRFRDLLNETGMFEKWKEYEDKRTREALIEWCKENKIEIIFG